MKRTLHISARLPGGDRYDAEIPIEHVVLLRGQYRDVLFVRMKATRDARRLYDLKHPGPYTVWVNDGKHQYYADHDAMLIEAEARMFIPESENYRTKVHRYQCVELYLRSTKDPSFYNRPEVTYAD